MIFTYVGGVQHIDRYTPATYAALLNRASDNVEYTSNSTQHICKEYLEGINNHFHSKIWLRHAPHLLTKLREAQQFRQLYLGDRLNNNLPKTTNSLVVDYQLQP